MNQVLNTVNGRKLVMRGMTDNISNDIYVEGVSPVIVDIVRRRGIPDEKLHDFFHPTIKSLMPNPNTLTDMDAMGEVISDAIINNVRIGIIGDYDVDGATSVSEFVLYCNELGYDNIDYIIPQRLTQGYGPNMTSIEALYTQGSRVLLILDSGTIAYKEIAFARELGMTVCVIDHHEPSDTWLQNKPDAYIVNPKRPDDTSGLDTLCTAGLVIMLLVSLSQKLVAKSYKEKSLMPNIMDFMGLAGLGTVADIMELQGLNRAFVKAGIDRITKTVGLKMLAKAALHDRLKEKNNITIQEYIPNVKPYDFGFTIGPCINAGGRINDCMLGANLLTEANEDEALKKSQNLIEINRERQELQAEVLSQVIEQIESEFVDTDGNAKDKIIVAYNEEWHPGVIGIVASKIRERYNVPAVIIGTGGKGSGRSAHGFDLGGSFIHATEKGILLKGGGHKMAGGLTVSSEKVSEFREFLVDKTKDLVEDCEKYDVQIRLSDVDTNVAKGADQMQPCGNGNPEPKYIINNCRITKVSWVGKNEKIHLRVLMEDGKVRRSAIVFGAKGTPIGDFLESSVGNVVSLVGSISYNPEFSNDDMRVNIKVNDAIIQ